MHFIEYCASERLQINERVPAGRATEQDKRGEECSDWMSFHIDLWVGVRLFVRVIMLCYALALQHEYMTLISSRELHSKSIKLAQRAIFCRWILHPLPPPPPLTSIMYRICSGYRFTFVIKCTTHCQSSSSVIHHLVQEVEEQLEEEKQKTGQHPCTLHN